MNIRDLSLLERLPVSLDELIEACRKDGPIDRRCPEPAADVRRRAGVMKTAVEGLRLSLDGAGPAPRSAKEKPPLYLRINECPEVREIARLVSYDGCLEDDLFVLTRQLATTFGNDRVSEAMTELTWIDRETRWAKLRPEVVRSCRVLIGPPPGDSSYELYWSDRGGVPVPRTPANPRRDQPQAHVGEETKPRKVKDARKPRAKKKSA